jgi:hypothetical protein
MPAEDVDPQRAHTCMQWPLQLLLVQSMWLCCTVTLFSGGSACQVRAAVPGGLLSPSYKKCSVPPSRGPESKSLEPYARGTIWFLCCSRFTGSAGCHGWSSCGRCTLCGFQPCVCGMKQTRALCSRLGPACRRSIARPLLPERCAFQYTCASRFPAAVVTDADTCSVTHSPAHSHTRPLAQQAGSLITKL